MEFYNIDPAPTSFDTWEAGPSFSDKGKTNAGGVWDTNVLLQDEPEVLDFFNQSRFIGRDVGIRVTA